MYFNAKGNADEGTAPTMDEEHNVAETTMQLQLPGMTYTRILNIRCSKSPFRFSLSTNPSSSKAVTMIWIGATSIRGGGFGISRTDESGNKNLIDFVAAVKSKFLSVEFDWDKENIVSYLVRNRATF